MSSHIWTPAALSSECAPLKAEVWRAVEAQHRISTMKLVDSGAEQALLERMIEDTKPPVPEDCRRLHYLLFTPFRYAPYPKGSRFRRAGPTPGVFYASAHPEAAVAEASFYRLLFFAESPGLPFPKNPGEYTVYSARIATPFAVDLTRPPFDADAKAWMHVTDYAPCQAFAESCRAAGVETIAYASVRDPAHRSAYAILKCCAFAAPKPHAIQTWHIRVSEQGAFASCEAPKSGVTFPLAVFLDDPRLAPLAA